MRLTGNTNLNPLLRLLTVGLAFSVSSGTSVDLFAAEILGGLNGVPSSSEITVTVGGMTET